MIKIINYRMGNLRSVQKAFERLNVNAQVTDNPSDLKKTDKIVLPGVGHFKQGMDNLIKSGFAEAILEAVTINSKQVMGICLGMQLLTEYSEEGNIKGLGLINAETKLFPKTSFKIPHMGWNSLLSNKTTSISMDIHPDELVYFVHSYFVKCTDPSDVLFQTNYGITFDSAFQHKNIIGFQFHPEKSHKVGLKLLDNFIKL